MFEYSILNFIYLVFPLSLYIIYCMYNSVFSKKTSDLTLTFFLVTSFYLLIRFGNNEIMGLPFTLTMVPLLIGYINKSKLSIITISVLTLIFYLNFNYGFLYVIVVGINYLCYIKLYQEKNYEKLFILIVILTHLSINLFNVKAINIGLFIYIGGIILFPYLIVMAFKNLQSVADIHVNLKNIEHDKQIKMSIFKISHEIKNPIAVCKGYLDMFDASNMEHSEKYIPIIRSEIDRTLCLLQNFLEFNKIKLELDEMDLILLLSDVKSSCIPIFNKKKIIYQDNINYDDEEIYFNGDYNRLKQVLINIIKNGIEAVKDSTNPCINIFYKVRNDYIHIYVEDNGCGMSREVLSKVKEPFFTTKEHGTGLGLSISHEIIQGHNGLIKYSSKENIGTKVEIILPLSNQK